MFAALVLPINSVIVCNNAFLLEVIESFEKRNKAIKHHNCTFSISVENEESMERLNIDARYLSSPDHQLRLSIWQDRTMYYRTSQSQKIGWKHNIQIFGNVSEMTSTEVEKSFEKAIGITSEKQLMNLWESAKPFVQ